MALKRYKSTSPGRRGMSVVRYRDALTTGKPKKSLTKGRKRSVGRANTGTITTRHKGGGHKRRYRVIDWKFDKKDVPAKVESIEYDPNRSGYISLVCYADGERRYILTPAGVSVGDSIIVAENAPSTPGNRLQLKNIPTGTAVYNIEIKENGGAKLVRSAGNQAIVQARDGGYVNLKMPSSEVRKIHENAWASIGAVSKSEHNLQVWGKAGKSRWKGIRPTVRGMAMNAVDHPMGGGEARGRGRRKRKKMYSGKVVDPLHKTRKPKKYSNKLIVSRRKVGKKR